MFKAIDRTLIGAASGFGGEAMARLCAMGLLVITPFCAVIDMARLRLGFFGLIMAVLFMALGFIVWTRKAWLIPGPFQFSIRMLCITTFVVSIILAISMGSGGFMGLLSVAQTGLLAAAYYFFAASRKTKI